MAGPQAIHELSIPRPRPHDNGDVPFARLQTTQAWHPGKLTDYALPDEQLATGLEVPKDLPKPEVRMSGKW
jgi:hypothetical protein